MVSHTGHKSKNTIDTDSKASSNDQVNHTTHTACWWQYKLEQPIEDRNWNSHEHCKDTDEQGFSKHCLTTKVRNSVEVIIHESNWNT